MTPLGWAIALLLAAMAFSFLEVFTPSMGILTAVALCCAIGSSLIAFRDGQWTGAIFVGLNAAGMGLSFLAGFKLMPYSPLAHRKSDVEDSTYQPVDPLGFPVGAGGEAFTTLRPGGTALINDRKVDVVAEGGYIEKGTRIRVLRIEGTKVVVEEERAQPPAV